MSFEIHARAAGSMLLLGRIAACAHAAGIANPEPWARGNAWSLTSAWLDLFPVEGLGNADPSDFVTDEKVESEVLSLIALTDAPEQE